MRRTKLILAVAATMVMMLALTAGPALAADNDRHNNRIDNRLDRLDNQLDNQLDRFDNTLLVGDLCSSGASDNLFVPGCVFTGDLFSEGLVSDDVLVSDLDHAFIGDIDNDFDHLFIDNDNGIFGDIDHANHNGQGHHGGGGGKR
jgi:hypothetical protein